MNSQFNITWEHSKIPKRWSTKITKSKDIYSVKTHLGIPSKQKLNMRKLRLQNSKTKTWTIKLVIVEKVTRMRRILCIHQINGSQMSYCMLMNISWIFIPTCRGLIKQNKACQVSAIGVCVRTTGRVSKWICSLHLDPRVGCVIGISHECIRRESIMVCESWLEKTLVIEFCRE